VSAADPVSIEINATVADDFELSANSTTLPTPANNNALADLVGGLSDLVIAQFIVKTNDPDGFRISLSSQNGGLFHSDNASTSIPEDMVDNEKMAFTLDLVKDGNLWGLTDASGLAIDISSGVVNRDFAPDGVLYTKATAPHELNFTIRIDAPANSTLMKATYSDTITYQVVDL